MVWNRLKFKQGANTIMSLLFSFSSKADSPSVLTHQFTTI